LIYFGLTIFFVLHFYVLGYFVAYSREKNYRIDYFDMKGGQLKGTIDLTGYFVKPTKAADPLRIVLAPLRENRRSSFIATETDDRKWVLSASSENERDLWMAVFHSVCEKLHPRYKEPELQSVQKSILEQPVDSAALLPSSWSARKTIELSAVRGAQQLYSTYTFTYSSEDCTIDFDSADASVEPGCIDLTEYNFMKDIWQKVRFRRYRLMNLQCIM
jgi:hypothetical protein